MEVWRIENSRGIGPYASGKPVFPFEQPYVIPVNSDCEEIPKGWVCGCPSKEILEWMFGPNLPRLNSYGFVIRKYEVPEGNYIIGKSGNQVVFKRTKTDIAKKLAAELKMPLLEIKIFD